MPPLSKYLGIKPESIGGWMISSLKKLKELPNIEIAVATFDKGSKVVDVTVDGIRYFLVPTHGRNPQKYIKKLECEWGKIKEIYRPDVVHIHGTEFPHGLAWIKACGADNVCVSIQGLVGIYARYYYTGSWLDHVPLTFRDLIKLDWITRQQKSFFKRGEYEQETLKSVNHIIGRTEWDKSHVWAINPDAKYHYCGETLRDIFYQHKWQYEKCEPHSIFLSQGSYPIKGLHLIIKMMPLILREYPDAKLYVGGYDINSVQWFRKGSYSVIIKKLIKKYHLEKVIIFKGMMDEAEMCKQYLKCNVFLLASAIENSPNSLGEAQLLEVPIISSYCGGTPELLNFDSQALYRYEEIEMLAKMICNIFEKREDINPKKFDFSRYDANINSRLLYSVYEVIAKR